MEIPVRHLFTHSRPALEQEASKALSAPLQEAVWAQEQALGRAAQGHRQDTLTLTRQEVDSLSPRALQNYFRHTQSPAAQAAAQQVEDQVHRLGDTGQKIKRNLFLGLEALTLGGMTAAAVRGAQALSVGCALVFSVASSAILYYGAHARQDTRDLSHSLQDLKSNLVAQTSDPASQEDQWKRRVSLTQALQGSPGHEGLVQAFNTPAHWLLSQG